MHESIGGGQISVSTSPTNSSSSIGKDDRVDDTPIEHTSFGGPAQNNTVKSHAEQMVEHRRVRIIRLCFWSIQRNIFFLKLNFGFCSTTISGLLFLAVTPDRGFFTASFADRSKRYSQGLSKGMLFSSGNKRNPARNSNITSFLLLLSHFLLRTICSKRSVTNISDAC